MLVVKIIICVILFLFFYFLSIVFKVSLEGIDLPRLRVSTKY